MKNDIELFKKGVLAGVISNNDMTRAELLKRMDALYNRLEELSSEIYFSDGYSSSPISVRYTVGTYCVHVEVLDYELNIYYDGSKHCFYICYPGSSAVTSNVAAELYSESDVIEKCGELFASYFVIRDVDKCVKLSND